MSLYAVVLFYTGVLLCCLPACSSQNVKCNITLDRKVYAFPSQDSGSESADDFNFKVDIERDNTTLFCSTIDWSIALDVTNTNGRKKFLDLRENLRNFTQRFSESKMFHQMNFTVGAKVVLKNSAGLSNGDATIFISFFTRYDNCLDIKVVSCLVSLSVSHDKAPSVLFKALLDDAPSTRINSTLDFNGISSSTAELEVKKISSKVVVDIEVKDGDDFWNNPDRFEYCAVSEPNITLSAVVTLFDKSWQNGNSSTPHTLLLATDVDGNQLEPWWNKSSARLDDTQINFLVVKFDFAVSAMCLAINALLGPLNSSSNFSDSSISKAIVNITINVVAKSGRSNPQKSIATLSLVQSINGGLFSAAAATPLTPLSLSHPTADADTITTANEESSAASSANLVAVLCAISSVILLLIVLWLLMKLRARHSLSCIRRPVSDVSSTTAEAHETCSCFSSTASRDLKPNDTVPEHRQGSSIPVDSLEVSTSLIEDKQTNKKSSASTPNWNNI